MAARIRRFPPAPEHRLRADAGLVDDPRPVLVCLNEGWGGLGRLEAALRRRGGGADVVAVYVLVGDPPRADAVRAAARALRRVRGSRDGGDLHEVVVTASTVPAGLALVTQVLGGEVAW